MFDSDEDDEDYVPKKRKKKSSKTDKKTSKSSKVSATKPAEPEVEEADNLFEAQGRIKVMVCCVCLSDRSQDDDEIVECDNCGISVHEGEDLTLRKIAI